MERFFRAVGRTMMTLLLGWVCVQQIINSFSNYTCMQVALAFGFGMATFLSALMAIGGWITWKEERDL